ncbi:MAG: hypothetical protein OFPI_07930 [Osedax symbiont Rs2]|nr:MAG: hypothetical protein OFPI_07930 [Osedax symbiont Rs2]
MKRYLLFGFLELCITKLYFRRKIRLIKLIGFRVDSSLSIGIGHVMRCLALAVKLKKKLNVRVMFFCRASLGNVNSLIKEAGFELFEMRPAKKGFEYVAKNGDWLGETQQNDFNEFLSLKKEYLIPSLDFLIIDHYGIDFEWQRMIRSYTRNILVIDDIGNRKHECEFLLDQTFNCLHDKYSHLVPKTCETLLGTDYALLREEFSFRYDYVASIRKKQFKNNILIMFGGIDICNHTLQTLRIIKDRDDINEVSVIMGASALHINEVTDFCQFRDMFKVYISPDNVAEIMLNATLAIGAAGTTSWERCATGLPSVVIIQAGNQRLIAQELEKMGVISVLEESDIMCSLNIQIDQWFANVANKPEIINKCLHICDGNGANRLVEKVFSSD